MNWFQNLPFRYKLMLPIGVLALVFAAFAIRSLDEISNLGGKAMTLVKDDIPAATVLLEADRDLYQAQVAERSLVFLKLDDPAYAGLLKQHSENIQQAHDRLNRFASIVRRSGVVQHGGIGEKLAAYEGLRKRWESLTNKVVADRKLDTAESRAAAVALSFGEAGTAFEEMRDVIDRITGVMDQYFEQSALDSQAQVETSRYHVITMVAIVLGVCGLLVGVLPSLITKPLHRMIAHVQDIAEGEGDLTVRLEAKTTDEMGQLATAFNQFVEKLQELVSGTVANSQALVSAAEQVARAASDNDRVVAEQLGQIEMVATAMNEMSTATQDVAANATQAAEGARAADGDACSGAQVVNATVASINQLADAVQNAAGAIGKLETESTNIGAVLEVIKGIAEQTSLLALNAAIEAARAGEQGRGFAVVADEVRTLASRTQQSTQEIEAMIESLQNSARDAVAVMQDGSSLADASVKKAAEAGGSLDNITNAVGTINDMNTQIASAAEEQSAVSEEINRNTTSIHTLAEQAAEGSRRTASTANELSTLAHQMQERMARFKV